MLIIKLSNADFGPESIEMRKKHRNQLSSGSYFILASQLAHNISEE